MHNIYLPSVNRTYVFASCLEELSPKDVIRFFELLYMEQTNQIDIDDFRRMLLFDLLKIKKTVKYYNLPDEHRLVIHDQIDNITKVLDSFYEWKEDEGQLVQELNLKFIKNLIPRIGKYVGPADAITNISYFEYKEALCHFLEYSRTKNDEDLCIMMAVLYRPRKKFFRIRQLISGKEINERIEFNSKSSTEKLMRRAANMRKVNHAIKSAVYIWFNNCINNIMNGKFNIDGHEIEFSVLFKGNGEDTGPSGIGLTGIVYSLAESAVFGNADETYNTNLYDVLARLYQLKIEHDKISKK